MSLVIGISTSSPGFFVQQEVLRIRLLLTHFLDALIARTFVFLDTDPIPKSNPPNDIASPSTLCSSQATPFVRGTPLHTTGNPGIKSIAIPLADAMVLVSRLALWVILITYPSKNHSVIHIAKTAIVDDGRIAIATVY